MTTVIVAAICGFVGFIAGTQARLEMLLQQRREIDKLKAKLRGFENDRYN